MLLYMPPRPSDFSNNRCLADIKIYSVHIQVILTANQALALPQELLVVIKLLNSRPTHGLLDRFQPLLDAPSVAHGLGQRVEKGHLS